MIWADKVWKSSFEWGLADRMALRSCEDEPSTHQHAAHAMWDRSPPELVAPSKEAAFSRSAEISLSLLRRALSRGSRTASSSYSVSSACAARVAFAASFSASLALSVPFFFGGATGTGMGLSSDSSSEEASQSL